MTRDVVEHLALAQTRQTYSLQMTHFLQEQLPILDQLRKSKLLQVYRNTEGFRIENGPEMKAEGLYWIYTSYSIAELKTCIPSPQSRAVNIPLLAQLHDGLQHVCTEKEEEYLVVYSGRTGKGRGLGNRLRDHFNGAQGNGCLGIGQSSLSDLTRWRVSFVELDPESGDPTHLACDFDAHSSDLERMWRLQHGWPLLCEL